MKIRRRTPKGANLWIYEAIECGKVVASGRSPSELRVKLKSLQDAKPVAANEVQR